MKCYWIASTIEITNAKSTEPKRPGSAKSNSREREREREREGGERGLYCPGTLWIM